MNAPVQLVFRGEVLAGFRLEDVQRELGRLLQADEARLKHVFSGRGTVLKRGLAAAEAQRYVSRLAAMGARVHVEPMPSPPRPAAASGWPTIAPPPEEDRRATAPVAPAAAPQATALPVASPAEPATTAAPAAAAAPRELELIPTAVPDEVVCPKCGERQSKRLLCRACTTNIEMAMAAKQEEEALRRAERQAALEARHHPRRRAAPEADTGERSAWAIGFRFSGRVGRLSSAAANLWLIAAMLMLTTGFLARPSLPRALLMGTGALAVFFFSMRLTVLRCHDCDRHGWWALFVLVPYVGSLASLLFALLPGNPDDNEYGPPPPKGRWGWLGLALVVLALSSALLVRASIRFAERYAAEQESESADEIVEFGGNASTGGGSDSGAAGLQEALRDYSHAPGHKAFAASSRQTYAWVGNAGSVDEAVRNAMSQCDARRQPYTPDCRVVNVNGQPGRN
jgi:uncharacterized membrane protein YhaH (DUF805 family)